MSLHNVIVISRRIEIQELAQQIADHVFAADEIPDAVELLERVSPDLILFDGRYSENDILFFVHTAESVCEAHIVIIGNGEGQTHYPEDLAEKVPCHYLNDAKDHQQLRKILDRIKQARSVENNTDNYFCDDLAASTLLAGKSTATLHTLKMIKLVAASQCNPVLIVGEMGTGKELAAKTIHAHRCADQAFVVVNCASLNANLLESELFGHEKGAFTSAEREKTGLLELAGTGCIFLDEISEMPIDLQAKILRVIQEKTFRKVGGTKEIACRATIIASSNRNLKEEVLTKRFRADLYHRLNVFPISLSPLRSTGRRDDIRLLAEYFLKTSTICPEKSARITAITQLALEALEKHDWPGNARELRNVIDRAILLETTDKIGLNSIIINPEEPEEFFSHDVGKKIKDFSLAKAEQELIARVLQETNWQKTKAAELLGISRATLYAKVKQHQIEMDSGSQQAESSGQQEIADSIAVA